MPDIAFAGHVVTVSPDVAHALISAGYAAPEMGVDYSAAVGAIGPVITPATSVNTFPATAAPGTSIGNVVDPFAALGGTTFETEGDGPPQLRLSGRTVSCGYADAAPGDVLTLTVRATAPDGRSAIGTSVFTAV